MVHAISRLTSCRFLAADRLTSCRLTSPAVSGVGLWLFGLLSLLLSPSSIASQLTLAWDAVSDRSLAGYRSAATAYDSSGNESSFSNEAIYDFATGDSLRRIVVFQIGTSAQVRQQVVTQSGSQVLNVLPLINGVAIKPPAQDTAQAIVALQAAPTVTGVYDDPAVAGQDGGGDNVIVITPVDPPTQELYPWGLNAIYVPDVHQKEPGLKGSGVTVAILDTGIDINHPDLSGNIKDGYNALAGQDPRSYQDDNGHGTHMAGIIAARMNRLGVIGAAYQAQIVAVNVLDHYGNGLLSDLINGLGWIHANKIKVVNMSLGFSKDNPLLAQAIERLYEAGVIMVASAGNQGVTCAQDGGGDDGAGDDGGGDDGGGDDGGGDSGCQPARGNVNYPARYPWVISVAATNGDGEVTGYSQSGKVDVAAPGGSKSGLRIFSTITGGGYGLGSGTSQAAAHVTGAITLALQKNPQLSVEEVVTLLHWTARDLGEPVERQGAGLIDIEAMINALKILSVAQPVSSPTAAVAVPNFSSYRDRSRPADATNPSAVAIEY